MIGHVPSPASPAKRSLSGLPRPCLRHVGIHPVPEGRGNGPATHTPPVSVADVDGAPRVNRRVGAHHTDSPKRMASRLQPPRRSPVRSTIGDACHTAGGWQRAPHFLRATDAERPTTWLTDSAEALGRHTSLTWDSPGKGWDASPSPPVIRLPAPGTFARDLHPMWTSTCMRTTANCPVESRTSPHPGAR